MNNFEKYHKFICKQIKENQSNNVMCLIRDLRGKTGECKSLLECNECEIESFKWLTEECKEPEIDWTTIEEGTVVMVRDANASQWSSRYFYFYSYNPLLQYPFIVSENATKPYKLTCWKQCKLVER